MSSEEPTGDPNQSQFYAIVGWALTDAEFRAELVEPETREGALMKIGIEPTQEVLDALAHAITSVDTLSAAFGASHIAS